MKLSHIGGIRHSRRGFTLIELLVVIAIIAILAAILFPVFAQAKSAAKKTTCLSNLHQIGLAFSMYTNDSSGSYPLASNVSWSDYQGQFMKGLEPYIKNQNIWYCPEYFGATKQMRNGYPFNINYWGVSYKDAATAYKDGQPGYFVWAAKKGPTYWSDSVPYNLPPLTESDDSSLYYDWWYGHTDGDKDVILTDIFYMDVWNAPYILVQIHNGNETTGAYNGARFGTNMLHMDSHAKVSRPLTY